MDGRRLVGRESEKDSGPIDRLFHCPSERERERDDESAESLFTGPRQLAAVTHMADDAVFRLLLGHELLYLTEERDLVPGQHFQIRFWSALCLLTACMNGFRML